MKNSIISMYLQLNFLIMWPTIHKASVPLRSFEEYIIWYCQKNIIKRMHVNDINFLIRNVLWLFHVSSTFGGKAGLTLSQKAGSSTINDTLTEFTVRSHRRVLIVQLNFHKKYPALLQNLLNFNRTLPTHNQLQSLPMWE